MLLWIPVYSILVIFVMSGADDAVSTSSISGFSWFLIGISLMEVPLGFVVPELAVKHDPNPDTESPHLYLAKCQNKMIIGNALFHSIAIYGFIGSVFDVQPIIMHGLIGFSFLLVLLNTVRFFGWMDEYRRRLRQ